ncbi:CHAP domain-containing protein [Nocardioides kongjuensis]|uniref:WXG100 family type VII secretion target n=1 Tax=Nocardioides kongjuensis TaxID=349522 RepID=A0A852S112_9ACTN|nr:CHAP domain-containing protein [Nocardioides kongjuensis]NYD33794.1 WXG100 family type VII secretion target [Nocardioides kongjuensis]
MNQFVGMDPAIVQQIGTRLKQRAAHLREITAAVESAVHSLQGNWDGQDATDFQAWWTHQHRPALTAVTEQIEGLGQSALNNAQEQLAVSGGAGAGPGAGAAPGHGGVTPVATGGPGAAPQGPGGGGAPSGAPQTDLDRKTAAFAATWNGKYLDYDKAYGNQCYDVFSQYNHDVVGGPGIHAATTGGAKDIYNDYGTNGAAAHYQRIAAGDGPPRVGDVVVWGNGTYGHVGVVTAVTDGGFTALEQNTDGRASSTSTGAVTHQVTHTYGEQRGILGYLRPKSTV